MQSQLCTLIIIKIVPKHSRNQQITIRRLGNMRIMVTYSDLKSLNIFGVGLAKVPKIKSEENFEIIFQMGIGKPLIQNVIEILKKEFQEKNEGTSIIPLEEFAIFINYFKDQEGKYLLLIYMYDKENSDIYSLLYIHSRKIKNRILSDVNISEIIKMYMSTINIPKVEGVDAIYILGISGIPYYSRINPKYVKETDNQLIGGFITALFNFSRYLIGEDSGASLKEINLGNRVFYTIAKKEGIFVFIADKMTPTFRRYMYIISDEFLGKYKIQIGDFDGNIAPFDSFNEIIDQYFVI